MQLLFTLTKLVVGGFLAWALFLLVASAGYAGWYFKEHGTIYNVAKPDTSFYDQARKDDAERYMQPYRQCFDDNRHLGTQVMLDNCRHLSR